MDGFLRDLWLECCGHLSAFTIDGTSYLPTPPDGAFGGFFSDENEEEMRKAVVGEVLQPEMKFKHEYDFGTTTELQLGVVGAVEIPGRLKDIRILARNTAPVIPCGVCGQPARWICGQCGGYEDKGIVCKAHAGEHECGGEMLLPLVNSPRVGQCGYTGPEYDPDTWDLDRKDE